MSGTTHNRFWARLKSWGKKIRSPRRLALMLSIAAIISTITSFAVITNSSNPVGPDSRTALNLVLVNMILLLALIVVVARRVVTLLAGIKQGSVGSRLQTRVVVVFSLISILPTIIISVFSALFFNYGIQAWFNERVSTGLEKSVAVAEAYLTEHRDTIRNDAIAMTSALENEWHSAITNPQRFNHMLNVQAKVRSINEAVVFQRNRIIAQTMFSFALAFEQMPQSMLDRASNGEVVIFTDTDDDTVRAIVRINTLQDTYLLVSRLVDSKVIDHVENAQRAVNEYRDLRTHISDLQIQFSVVFVLVSVLLLLSAIWYGMYFAAKLVNPVSRLVNATERVRAGDFATRVDEGPQHDEIATLGRAFNRMTGQLETQRQELIDANRVIDERRRFSEAVLAGVSAGIVALDANKCISLYNRSAAGLLTPNNIDEPLKGQEIIKLLPQIAELISEAEKKPDRLVQGQITLSEGDKASTLHIRISTERNGNLIEGFVVTFDDISELLGAQRRAAWADVARRVAHEIKNPLTPIQLAAERLRKKYYPQIQEDGETYIRYIDTISRHVGDIGKMVDEFVTFARMPTAIFREEDVTGVIKKVLFSEQVAHPDITYHCHMPTQPLTLICDERQVTQLLINLLKNAAEALESRPVGTEAGIIDIAAYDKEDYLVIEIKDNGPGFPPDKINSIMEPYVTTRSKGTGLGLAIVKKSMEEHKGTITVSNLEEGGGCVTLAFSKQIETTVING